MSINAVSFAFGALVGVMVGMFVVLWLMDR